jgi:hypothetical protein
MGLLGTAEISELIDVTVEGRGLLISHGELPAGAY